MSWENEQSIYANKLSSIISGVKQIDKLAKNRIISDSIKGTLREQREAAECLLPKIKDGKFEVAVVGVEKSGKSSFSNALMGLNLLPTAEERCTYTSTAITFSDTDRTEINFWTVQDFKRSFREKLEKMNIPDADAWNYDTLSLAQYEQLFDACPDDIHRLYGDSLNQDIRDIIENADELRQYIGSPTRIFDGDTSDRVKPYITDPGKAIAVKEILIYSSKLKEMPDATIYDVPGFNSPTAMHRKQTLEKMRAADAIIMVTKADEPSITGDVLSVFRESDEDGAQLKDKLFIFANKADRAADLEENIQKTYYEWIDKRKIASEREKGRFFFGSADAALGDKVPTGREAREKLASQGRSDGIEELRSALLAYYKTKRFDVLKKRTDKIIAECKDIFQSIMKDNNSDSLTENDSTAMSGLVLDIGADFYSRIRPALRNLKDEENERLRSEYPLYKQIENKINQLITIENYHVSDDDIKRLHRDVAGISSSQQPSKVDAKLREERFDSIYSDFCDLVLDVAEGEHLSICGRVEEIFLRSMNIEQDSPLREPLLEKVREFCGLSVVNANCCYQSLIERFARDVFEILIKFARGTDRLNKFKDEAPHFFSLGIYYAAAEAKKEPCKNPLEYISVSPKDSPLWQILLYPEKLRCSVSSTVNDLWLILQNIGINKADVPSLCDSLEQLVLIYGESAAELLKEQIETIPSDKADLHTIGMLKDSISQLIGDKTQPDLLESILNGSKYQMDVADKHANYTYKTVQEEFDNDLLALHDILVTAFLYAIGIDKAFSANETKLLEDIYRSIDIQSEKFRDFIRNNWCIIRSEETKELKRQAEERNADKAVIDQVKLILENIE